MSLASALFWLTPKRYIAWDGEWTDIPTSGIICLAKGTDRLLVEGSFFLRPVGYKVASFLRMANVYWPQAEPVFENKEAVWRSSLSIHPGKQFLTIAAVNPALDSLITYYWDVARATNQHIGIETENHLPGSKVLLELEINVVE